MSPLFSKTSLMVLESLSFTNTLYAFDFDGTLAKIVKTPSAARMTQVTEALLRQLGELAPIAIISGRSISDLKSRLLFRPRYLIGNHGLENLGNNEQSLLKAKEMSESWLKILKAPGFDAGIEVEDKVYSLAIHYRRCKRKFVARAQIKERLELLDPAARVILGKYVVNIVPPGSPHKGIAILDLLRHSGMKHMFYIGDDVTDEDVFSLPYNTGQILAVRVGRKKNSSARYYIERQSEINRLLKLLISYYSPKLKEIDSGGQG